MEEHIVRMSFDELFRRNAEGMISPRLPVQIGGVTVGPGGASDEGASFGGVDLAQFLGKDLDVEIQDNIHVIKGTFN